MLSNDVRRFVLTSIPSVPYLEAALLFRRSPGQALGAAEVARALYLGEDKAEQLLRELRAAGIVTDAGTVPACVYAPRDENLATALDGLAEAYAGELIAVTKLIHDSTQRSAQRFADAFKLRKEP